MGEDSPRCRAPGSVSWGLLKDEMNTLENIERAVELLEGNIDSLVHSIPGMTLWELIGLSTSLARLFRPIGRIRAGIETLKEERHAAADEAARLAGVDPINPVPGNHSHEQGVRASQAAAGDDVSF